MNSKYEPLWAPNARIIKLIANFAIIIITLLFFSFNIFAAVIDTSSLSDIAFGVVKPGDVTRTMDENVCVVSATGQYEVRILGIGPGGSYIVRSGNQVIRFEVRWNDQANTAGNQPIQPNVPKIFGNASKVAGCPGGPTANIQIIVPGNQLAKAVAGSYRAPVSIVVSPI